MAKDYYKLIEENNDIDYIVNTNKTILYIFNNKKNLLSRHFRDTWPSMEKNVIKVNKDIEEEVVAKFDKIVENNNFMETCQIISSTLKPIGFFKEGNDFDITTSYLNEFLGSTTFLNCLENNKYNTNDNPIDLLKEEAPTIYILLSNLFYNESEEILLNFIKWLKVVSFEDKHQDIMWLFFGTNEENQGQGAGKGVLRDLLSYMFSGLVASVSNTTYKNNFNSNLMNKKIVIFDEMDLKSLRYETLKDISGSPQFRVEFKGKEPLSIPNVSSWLCFSNQWDLYNTITQEDRRMFIIRPNPKNNSLKDIINEKYENYANFFKTLKEEIENFINIIALVDSKVLTPIELVSNAKIEYFKEKSNVSVKELEDFSKLLTNKNAKKKLYDIFNVIVDIDPSKEIDIANLKKVLDLDCINYKTFNNMFTLLQEFDYISKSIKLNHKWELTKEKLLTNDFISKRIGLKKTKTYGPLNDNVLIKKGLEKSYITKINNTLRKIFSEKLSNS